MFWERNIKAVLLLLGRERCAGLYVPTRTPRATSVPPFADGQICLPPSACCFLESVLPNLCSSGKDGGAARVLVCLPVSAYRCEM